MYIISLVAQTVKRLSTMRETWVGKIRWRRKWQSTPVLLPGKSHGQRSLVGYSLWGLKESDTTEQLHFMAGRSCEQDYKRGSWRIKEVSDHSSETLVWVNKLEASGKPDRSNCQSGAMKQS